MKDFFRNLFKPSQKYEGALVDNRTEEEKKKDWLAEEVFAFGIPVLRTVQENEWKKYSIRNQDGSGSCVAQSIAKFLEIQDKRHSSTVNNPLYIAPQFSATPIYQRRVNKPAAGMGYPDCCEIVVKYGTCLESKVVSQNMTDAQMDAVVMPKDFDLLSVYNRPTAYYKLPNNFYDVADYVLKHGAVIIWIISDYQNWNKDIPTLGGKQKGDVRHSITVVDAVEYQGNHYLVVEDSWGQFGAFRGQRLISNAFFNDSVYMQFVLTDFTYGEDDKKYTEFTIPLQFGMRGTEVERLQQFLQSRGFFPKDADCTGYYGKTTAGAILAFQIAKNVDTVIRLTSLKGRYVGPKTLAVINKNL